MKIYKLDNNHPKKFKEYNKENYITNKNIYTNLLNVKLLIDKYAQKWEKYKKKSK